MTTIHSRQNSFASSFVSTSANGLGISTSSKTSNSRNSTPNNKSNHHPLQIGPWKLGRTLGKGSTGRVLLASNVNTGQKAAVKVVSKSILQGTNNNNNNKNENSSISSSTNSNSSDEINRDSAGLSYGIEREIIIMKLLNHKNVLRLYDVWETDKALYLVLEYVEGGELFDLLVESGPLPEKTAVEFFKKIILGASYCHNLGICHRDLKPENLLLDKDLNIKIADFGMAALESNDRLLETSCGSPHYAAPEIVRGLQYHGSASDVWSCGVILFALLTGRLPFDDENIRNLLLKVQKGDYEIIDDENISIEAQSLISKMLTVDPNERIKTKDILSHPLILKYPFTKQEQQDIYNLPSPTSATKPVNSIDEIDKQILENLVILWHGKDKDSIVKSLLNNEPNPEKTFYSLLLRYRHEHNKTQGNNNHRNSLVRSSSVISKVSSSSSSGNNSSSTTPKRKSRNISASSSHKRPVSFQSIKSNNNNNETQFTTPTKSNRQSLIISNNATAPPLPKGVYDELVQHKRGIKISPENQQAMNSLSGNNTSNKRSSMLFTNDSNVIGTAPTNFNNNGSNSRNSLQLSRRLSNGSKLKRNSITSKVLSTYTKLQTFDAQKDQELKNYGKRTSADFATLCDMLFNKDNELLEDDEDEANNNGNNDNLDVPTKRKSKMVSLPSSSSFATLSRFIMEDNNKPRHASKRQSSSNYKNKRLSVNKSSNNNRQQRNSIISAKKRQSSFNDYFNSPVKSNFDISSQNSTTITTSPVKSKSKSNKRASSNPIERISRILNANDIQTISTGGINNNNNNTRSLSAFGASTESTSNPLGPPPKPISRLDPRYKAYENYQKRASLDAARVLALAQKEEEQRQKEKEKAELRRKKIEEAKIQAAKEIAAAAAAEQELARLKAEAEAEEAEAARIHAELKRKASQRTYGYDDEEDDDDDDDEEDDDFEGMYEDGKLEDEETFTESSPNSVKRYSRNSRPITLADVKIPQVTRRSRHFPGNSNRLSVLSIYSSGMANSSTNLAGFLKDGSNSGSNNRESKNTRLSMLFEDEDDTVDMKFDLNQNGQLDENDNESLFFVNQKKNKQNRQSLLLAQSPALNEKNKPTLAPAVLNYKESKDTLISQNSNDNLYKAFKLPEIPGSPIKDDTNRKRASQQQQQQQQQQQRFSSSKYDEPVDIFTDNNTVVADLENNAGVPSRPAPAAPPVENIRASKINGKFEFKEASTTNNNVASPVVKERKPLGEIDKATQQRKDNKRKNSFFRKLSFGKQQQQVEESERKTSITKAFLSLFQHDDADFETLQLDTVLSQQDVFDALNSLFVSWKQHGINKLQVQKELHKMTASISKENALGLKQCKIGVSVASVQKSVKGAKKSPKSRLVFSNLKGSSKSFKKLVGEIRSILDNENVLVVA